MCVYVSTSANLFSLWRKHYAIANAIAIEQNTAWTKISGKLCVCVCKYICWSFFFMNETLCYNTIAIEQNMAWTKISGKLCVCASTSANLFSLWTKHYASQGTSYLYTLADTLTHTHPPSSTVRWQLSPDALERWWQVGNTLSVAHTAQVTWVRHHVTHHTLLHHLSLRWLTRIKVNFTYFSLIKVNICQTVGVKHILDYK